jgi:hypothetical protein
MSAVVGLLAALLVAAPAAHAAPTPSPSPTPSATKSSDPCRLILGDAKEICERGQPGHEQDYKAPSTTDTTDPISSLAKAFSESAGWVVKQLSNAVAATSTVDFTNQSFLKTYSLVFAASTFLVITIWLWAVIKRAIRGVPLTTAIGEAIGLLWLTVIASAFTPLILYVVVQAVDGITEALAGGQINSGFFDSLSKALNEGSDGGPIMQIILGLFSIVVAGVVWFEMVIREALLYVGAALGTVVYSGLVDKELWNKVKKWAGMMLAIILVKPIVVIVLDLASALTNGGAKTSSGAIISGLSIILIAIFASAMIFRMVPGMGDEIVAARRDSYDPASRQSAAIVTKPVSGITQGINTHASRDSASRGASASAPASSSSVSHTSSGIAAHSTRPTSSGGGGARPAQPNIPNPNQTNRNP